MDMSVKPELVNLIYYDDGLPAGQAAVSVEWHDIRTLIIGVDYMSYYFGPAFGEVVFEAGKLKTALGYDYGSIEKMLLLEASEYPD